MNRKKPVTKGGSVVGQKGDKMTCGQNADGSPQT